MTDAAPQTVYAKTPKGVREIKEQKIRLPLELGLVFLSVDGKATLEDLLPISGMTAAQLQKALQALVEQGYVELAAAAAKKPQPDTVSPRPSPDSDMDAPKQAVAAAKPAEEPRAPKRLFGGPVLDLTNLAQKLRAKVAAERRTRQHLEKTIQLGTTSRNADDTIPHIESYPARGASQLDREQPGDVPEDGDASTQAGRVSLEQAMLRSARTGPGQREQGESEGPTSSLSDEIDDDSMRMLDARDPRHERLNADRAAHDVLAEAAHARRAGHTDAMGRHTRDATRPRADEEARSAARARRRKWRTRALMGTGIAVGLAPVLACAWLQLVPINEHIPDTQRILTARLNQPVQITTMRYVMLPSPMLILEGVTIGAAGGLHVARVEAPAWPQRLFDPTLAFDTIYAQGIRIEPRTLTAIPSWTGGKSNRLHLKRVELRDVTFNLPEAKVATLHGEVTFAPDGAVQRAVVENEKLRFDIVPRPGGARFTLNARDMRIPFGPNVSFSHLTIDGIAGEEQFTSTQIEGYLRGGGSLGATLTAKWSNAIVLAGTFNVQNARLQELMPAAAPDFSARGLLKASGRYTLEGPTAEGRSARSLVDATFSVTGGELTNVDLMRATQQPAAGSIFGAGRTPFRELTGALHVAGSHYAYRQLQLVSGPLNATGQVEIAPEGQLKGRITAEFAPSGAVPTRSGLTVAGTVKEPQLVY